VVTKSQLSIRESEILRLLENARKRGEEVEVWDWNNHCNTVEGFISPTMQGPTSG
jgi:hypothetical protein